jgi:prepilin-type N-terminal cleavage/methylation domain-containing protein
MANQRRRSGFSMIELLVAVAILTIVVSGVMECFVVQNRAYTVVDQTTESQQNLRAISHLMERDLRMTGFMVPEGAAACGIDETTRPDTLYVTDAEPVDPNNQPLPNLSVRVMGGYNGAVGTLLSLATVAGVPAAPSTVLDGQPYYDTNTDGVADSDFRVGGGVILIDVANPDRGTACGIVDDVRPGVVRVEFETSIGPTPGNFVMVPANRYAVDQNGNLTRNDLVLVTDVDDFQVAYFLDADRNGVLTNANEYAGSHDANNSYQAQFTDHSDLREVRFNLVLRTRSEDVEYSEGLMQPTENRAAVALPDGFRRRVVTSTVRPRNIGFRGAVANAG